MIVKNTYAGGRTEIFVIHPMNTMTYAVSTILKIVVTVENTLDLVGVMMIRIM